MLHNVFLALMPAGRIAGQPKSFGREDYLTECLGVLLHADSVAGGTLCAELLRRLFAIELHGQPAIATQVERARSGKQTSYIDLQVTTKDQIIFLEHKTGSQLGANTSPDGESLSQLQFYQAELTACTDIPQANRHLCMLTWSPTPAPPQLDYWRGARYWWDLYTVLAGAQEDSPSEHVRVLRTQFIALLDELQLSPPEALTKSNVHDTAVVQRVLAMALDAAATQGAHFSNVRPASWGAYLFTSTHPSKAGALPASPVLMQWTAGLWRGYPEIHCGNQGHMPTTLPSDFYVQSLEEQIHWIVENVWMRIARVEGLTKQLPLMTKGEALDRCGASSSEAVAVLLDRAVSTGWRLYIGGREIVLSLGKGASCWKLKLDTWHKSGLHVRIETPGKTSAANLLRSLTPHVAKTASIANGTGIAFKAADLNGVGLAGLATIIASRARKRPGAVQQPVEDLRAALGQRGAGATRAAPSLSAAAGRASRPGHDLHQWDRARAPESEPEHAGACSESPEGVAVSACRRSQT